MDVANSATTHHHLHQTKCPITSSISFSATVRIRNQHSNSFQSRSQCTRGITARRQMLTLSKSPTIRFSPKRRSDFVLTGLSPNTRYYYRIVYSLAAGENQRCDEYTFHTQRSPGNSFVFTVQSDSHLDENTQWRCVPKNLTNALSDQPDFHIRTRRHLYDRQVR